MAAQVLQKSDRPDLQQLAQAILATQQTEIDHANELGGWHCLAAFEQIN